MSSINKRLIDNFVSDCLTRTQGSGNERVLDLGCGSRPFRKIMMELFTDVVAFDVEVRCDDLTVLGDAHKLPFLDESFDIVVCCEVFEHLHDLEQAIAEISRVLRPGGKLICSWPFIFPMHEIPFDFQRITPFGFDKICSEVNLESPTFFFRGGAFVVFWVLVDHFVRGAAEFVARKIRVRAIVHLTDFMFSCVDKVVATVILRRYKRAPFHAADASVYSGVSGQNRRWALGFLAETRKCR